MFETDDLTIDCQTCLATNTTACNECIVTHLLANDDGPIEFLPAPDSVDPVAWAVELFARAGLIDDEPVFVPYDEFEPAPRLRLVR